MAEEYGLAFIRTSSVKPRENFFAGVSPIFLAFPPPV
jgi:hypothetical protein